MSHIVQIWSDVVQSGGALFRDVVPEEGESTSGFQVIGGPKVLPIETSDFDFSGKFFDHFANQEGSADLDDMVWFVADAPQDGGSRGFWNAKPDKPDTAEASPPSSPTSTNPQETIDIRRRTSPESFPPPNAPHINWRATVFLNIITQWSFELTVGVCRSHIEGRRDLVALKWVKRRVYAQPSSPESLEKAEMHRYTWPNVFFTVDDFAEAFGDIKMEEGQGWCVELVANSGDKRIPVFRGAVPYHKMAKMFETTVSKGFLPKLTGKTHDVINMKGPGGRGSAKASVTVVESSLRCCLVNLSAHWCDIEYCLERPITTPWLHIPTDEELAEELLLNRELSDAKQRAAVLDKLAKEDAKSTKEGTLSRASKKAGDAVASASKLFGGFLSKKDALLSKKQPQEDPYGTPLKDLTGTNEAFPRPAAESPVTHLSPKGGYVPGDDEDESTDSETSTAAEDKGGAS